MDREFASLPMRMAKAEVRDGNTLVGYASRFNHPIEPEATGLPYTTFFKPGAFKKTLQEQQPQVLFNHGFDPQVGEKPLGVPSVLREDDVGLYAEVPLDDTSYNADIRASLRSGALRAMSIAFQAKDVEFNEERTERYITQARLFEFGPVTFPANTAATAALHSLAGMARELTQGVVENDQQAETSDPDRLTWLTTATTRNRELLREIEREAAWLARARGETDVGGSAGASPGAARPA